MKQIWKQGEERRGSAGSWEGRRDVRMRTMQLDCEKKGKEERECSSRAERKRRTNEQRKTIN